MHSANPPLPSQSHLFPAAAISGYLNGASRAPQLHAVAEAGRQAIAWREQNAGMPISEFFGPVVRLRETFARLINCPEADRIALIPAASYGLATAAKNLPLAYGQNIVVVEDQFPSNYYVWAEKCRNNGADLRIVARPTDDGTATWSDCIANAIDANTAAVAIAPLHWADGTLFDLATLRQRTRDVNAWLILDGTQSVGALPFDVQTIQPDVLVCAGYKWLMGPYGCGYAYYGECMDHGTPLEENWINRAGSEDFRNLVNYQDDYRPKAGRYSVGEHSNFLMAPMQLAGLEQVISWGPTNLQAYCGRLWFTIADSLRSLEVQLPDHRAHHLVGLRLPPGIHSDKLIQELSRRNLTVSYRGDAIRVSPNVYNTEEEMIGLLMAIRAS